MTSIATAFQTLAERGQGSSCLVLRILACALKPEAPAASAAPTAATVVRMAALTLAATATPPVARRIRMEDADSTGPKRLKTQGDEGYLQKIQVDRLVQLVATVPDLNAVVHRFSTFAPCMTFVVYILTNVFQQWDEAVFRSMLGKLTSTYGRPHLCKSIGKFPNIFVSAQDVSLNPMLNTNAHFREGVTRILHLLRGATRDTMRELVVTGDGRVVRNTPEEYPLFKLWEFVQTHCTEV